MSRTNTHEHGLGIKIALGVLALLLATIIALFYITHSGVAAGAGKLAAGTGQASSGAASLAGGAQKLESGATTLAAGTKKLSTGTTSADAGAQRLASGSDTLNAGVTTLAAGTDSLASGSYELAEGAAQLVGGAGDAASGSARLSAGAAELSVGTAQLTNGLTSAFGGNQRIASGILTQGTTPLNASINGPGGLATQVQAVQAINDTTGLVASLGAVYALGSGQAFDQFFEAGSSPNAQSPSCGAAGAPTSFIPPGTRACALLITSGAVAELNAKIQIRSTPDPAAPTLGEAVAGLDSQVGKFVNGGQFGGETWPGTSTLAIATPTGNAELDKTLPLLGAAKLASGAQTLSSGAAALASGNSRLATGADTLNAGVQRLSSGATTLNTGAQTLATGAQSLKEGAASLSTGVTTLKNGAPELHEGAAKLSSGATELSDGADTLASGSDEISTGAGTLATASAGITPMTLPWLAGLVLAGLIGIALWIVHRVRHARLAEAMEHAE